MSVLCMLSYYHLTVLSYVNLSGISGTW